MNAERFALDTNVLIYTVSRDDPRAARAQRIVRLAAPRGAVLALQSLGEFYAVVTRKNLVAARAAADMIHNWITVFPTAAATLADVEQALAGAAAGRFSYWDALLLATVGAAGCSTLLSEDMQDGTGFAGVTVWNPFAGDDLPPRVAALLGR